MVGITNNRGWYGSIDFTSPRKMYCKDNDGSLNPPSIIADHCDYG